MTLHYRLTIGAVRNSCVCALLAWLLLGTTDRAAAQTPEGPTPDAAAEEERPALGNTLIPFPFYFYSPETKSGGGISLSYVVRAEGAKVGDRPDNYGAIALYTQRKQYSVGLSAERYLAAESWYVRASSAYSEFPTTFYGVGNDTDADLSEDYTPRTFSLDAAVERRVRGRWRTGPSLFVAHERIADREEDAVLVRPDRLGGEGGTVVTLGWAAVHDGRDQVFYPRSGVFARLSWELTDDALGSDYDYFRQSADLRWYGSLGEESWGSPVLALRALVVHTTARVPFQLLAELGGPNLLRGHYQGRFRDRDLWAVQSELRLGHVKRLGLALFAAAGDVAPRFGSFRLEEIRGSAGLGLRWQLSREEGIQIRADLGIDDEGGSGFYLAFLEAY